MDPEDVRGYEGFNPTLNFRKIEKKTVKKHERHIQKKRFNSHAYHMNKQENSPNPPKSTTSPPLLKNFWTRARRCLSTETIGHQTNQPTGACGTFPLSRTLNLVVCLFR